MIFMIARSDSGENENNHQKRHVNPPGGKAMKFTTATVTNAAMIGLLPASRTGLDVAVRQGVRRTGANLLAPLDIRRTRIYAQQPTRKNKYSGAERIWTAKLASGL